MRQDRHDDLVSTTAILAGGAVSVVVTVLSILFSGDESAPARADTGALPVIEIGALPPRSVAGEGVIEPGWTDPRGPDLGPTDLEWRVIETYRVIESMTAEAPSDEVVDGALVELWTYAREYPGNPFIQELHLKGLRVAQYWAFERGDRLRAAMLKAQFDRDASGLAEHELTVLEEMRMIVQKLEQRCVDLGPREAELRRLSRRFPSRESELVLMEGMDAARACLAAEGGR